MISIRPITPLATLRQTLPNAACDIKLSMASLITSHSESVLSHGQKWGVALASAMVTRCPALTLALKVEAALLVDEGALDAATTAASIIGMTNVYYRPVHMAQDADLANLPTGLRMNSLAKPGAEQADLKLFWLAASVVKGCATCIKTYVDNVRRHGASTEANQSSNKIATILDAGPTEHFSLNLKLAAALPGRGDQLRFAVRNF